MHRTAQIAQHVIASAVSTTDIHTGKHALPAAQPTPGATQRARITVCSNVVPRRDNGNRL